MNAVSSRDGTTIVYDKRGTGPAVILVDGALTYRSFGPMSHLAELLSSRFTVYDYDRRGRGDSSNSLPYTVEREVEDLEALIQEAGGNAFVYGISSGACLALEAAIKLGMKIEKLALYEPPYYSEKSAPQAWKEYREQLTGLLAAGHNGEAVVLFMQFVGTPADQIGGMRQSPMWPLFEAVAPTLAYDAATMGVDRSVPVKRAAEINSPTLVMNGTSVPFMLDTAIRLAKAIPHAEHRTLKGQTHDVNLEILYANLTVFFTS
jgi:pimeloyl-ACP methyl ester carboxylesterase